MKYLWEAISFQAITESLNIQDGVLYGHVLKYVDVGNKYLSEICPTVTTNTTVFRSSLLLMKSM